MVIARYAKRKPVMVFCATRKAASKTASVLANLWTVTAPQDRLWSGPKQCIKVTDHELQGIAYAMYVCQTLLIEFQVFFQPLWPFTTVGLMQQIDKL